MSLVRINSEGLLTPSHVDLRLIVLVRVTWLIVVIIRLLLNAARKDLRLKILLTLLIERIFSARHRPIIGIALMNATKSIRSSSVAEFSRRTPFESRAYLLSIRTDLVAFL